MGWNWRDYKEDFQSQGHTWIPSNVYVKLKNRTDKCESCGKFLTWNKKEIHHKIPVSKGGTNDVKNLMIVCKNCHKKLDKEAGVFYKGWHN